jgi:hypothetical protein
MCCVVPAFGGTSNGVLAGNEGLKLDVKGAVDVEPDESWRYRSGERDNLVGAVTNWRENPPEWAAIGEESGPAGVGW